MREGTLTLRDGRRLGFGVHGAADGVPIIANHGLPGSRHLSLDATALEEASARYVMVERPGFGLSDRHEGRTLADLADDVAELADHLELDRFAVSGASAGTAAALTLGQRLSDRVTMVGLWSAMAPSWDRPEFDGVVQDSLQLVLPVAREDPEAAYAMVQDFGDAMAQPFLDDADAYFESWVADMSDSDAANARARRDMWMACFEATYAGAGPVLLDEVRASYLSPLGFAFASYPVPIRIWHGAEDSSGELLRHIVAQAPDAILVEYPGEAHLLSVDHHPEWLEALTASVGR